MSDLSVASWNIRAGLGRDFRRQPARTIDAIVGFDADVVLLQEADFRLHPRPAALPRSHGRIGPFEVVDLTENAVGLGWHGIALLKRPGIEVEAIHLHDLPSLEPRGVVIVDLTVRGLPVRIVGVHLGLLRGNRRKQLGFIVDRLAELAHRPTVIAGDYNEWRDRHGFEAVPDWLSVHSPGPTFPAGRPFLRLDRLAFSRDLELLGSSVIAGPEAVMASDHRPILGHFRLLAPAEAVSAAAAS
ncbi:endonuclease/exonuclease/phosphatase family protein [Pseudotabrizicola algicola]|uniref:Metal-dependent hydrolase n=1 Tax=Pseudotabrizicola algicola TaxID=2709381 RepID=A0A6B3RML6_9RHOB|nr:endonuclease/exonuclease/phosphatase family protein [Pseudotabrizicola algicola]NEX47290.1 metal-dependent hydrolase [Pseudotabrizicola algicola]